MKVKCVCSSWKYWSLFSHRHLQTSKSITTMFREQKTIAVIDRFRFGVSLKLQTSSTLLEAYLLPVHQETKLLTPTSAAEWSLYFLHVQVLRAHFPSAANLVWWRSVPAPRVTHGGAQVTARSRTSTLPSTHYPESSFDAPRVLLFPRTHK